MSFKGILLSLLVLVLAVGSAGAAFVQLDADIRGGTIDGVAITNSSIGGVSDIEDDVAALEATDHFAVPILVPSAPVDGIVFIAPWNCTIDYIKEAHRVAQNTAFPNTGSVNLMKAASGAGTGTLLHNTTMWLNSTINVPQTPTLNATTNSHSLTAGQMIYADYSGTVTTLAGITFTIGITPTA